MILNDPPPYHNNAQSPLPSLETLDLKDQDLRDDISSESDIELWSDSYNSDDSLNDSDTEDQQQEPEKFNPPAAVVRQDIHPRSSSSTHEDEIALPTYEESQSQALQQSATATLPPPSQFPRYHETAPPPLPPRPKSPQKNLTHPILIPHRRTKPGFVRVYAPSLEASGISSSSFHGFLKNLHKTSQTCPAYARVRVSIETLSDGELPVSVIARIVGVRVLEGRDDVGKTRTRTDRILDSANEELFRPAGLCVMVVRFVSAREMGGEALIVEREEGDYRSSGPARVKPMRRKDRKRHTVSIASAPLRSISKREAAPLSDRNDISSLGPLSVEKASSMAHVSEKDDHSSISSSRESRRQTARLDKEARRLEREKRHLDRTARRAEKRIARGREPKDRSRHEAVVVRGDADGKSAHEVAEAGPSTARHRSPRGGKLYREDEESVVQRRIREGVVYLLIVNAPADEELAMVQAQGLK